MRKMHASWALRPYVHGVRIPESVWHASASHSAEAAMPVRRCILMALLATPLPVARAQSVHGVVVDLGDRPVPGVVVLLLDSASKVAARALTNERGEFRVSASQPGGYRVRTMRIGLRPVVSETVALPVVGDLARRVVLSGLPLALDTMHVVDRNACRAFTDSGAATFAVWDQIRTALIAAELTAASRTIAATTVGYERALDLGPGLGTGRVLRQHSTVSTNYVTNAWRTLPPDSLRRVGYVVTDRDNSTVYYAPGLDMLLSSRFVDDHCFRLTTDRKQIGALGIIFEPTPERKKGVPEIRGTLWLDRASSELRRLEFRYVNVSPDQEEQAGGDLEFVRMRDGAWAISRWNIRMPVVVQVDLPGHGTEPRVTELRVAGGELALARRANDTLWSAPPRVLTGILVDSLSGSPVAGASVAISGTDLDATSDARGTFAITGILPGQYTLHVRTRSLDSMNAIHQSPFTFTDASSPLEVRVPSGRQLAASLCGAAADHAGVNGIIVGSIRFRADSTMARGVSGAKVVAEWHADPLDSTKVRRTEVRSTSGGGFRFCGVPLNAALTLSATTDSAETAETSVVRIPPNARLARAELELARVDQLARRGAAFTGMVVNDSTREPISGAEVAVPDLGKSVVTDRRGAFKLTGISAGEHQIVVRRIGYAAADARVVFDGHDTVERRVVLGRAVTLETVTVTEKATERAMASFEENRRLGLGHFVTRGELEKYTGMKLASVLQQIPQLDMRHGRGEQAWVSSRHARPPQCPPAAVGCYKSQGFYVPDAADAFQGMPIACYALVYVDDVLMNGATEPTEPFDISSIAPEQVDAVEFYSGPAQTPLKYSRMGSNCGVLVIWRRRSP
jgi:hypothetical protein